MIINNEAPYPPPGLDYLVLSFLTSSRTDWEMLFFMNTNIMLNRMHNWRSCSSVLADHLGSQWALTASMLSVPSVLKTLKLSSPMFSPGVFQLRSSPWLSMRSKSLIVSFESYVCFSASGKPAVAFWYNCLPSEVDSSMVYEMGWPNVMFQAQ